MVILQAKWPNTTTFRTALGPMGIDSGIRVLALRPIKSDVLVECERVKVEEAQLRTGVGYEQEKVQRELGETYLARLREESDWEWKKIYGVMQYSDGKQL